VQLIVSPPLSKADDCVNDFICVQTVVTHRWPKEALMMASLVRPLDWLPLWPQRSQRPRLMSTPQQIDHQA